MNGYLAGFLAVVSGIAVAAAGEFISEEIRDRLDQLPRGILRLAARWLDPGQRATVYRDEWEPELVYILKGAEARPVTRLITGTWYALGILINTRRIVHHLHRPAPEQPDLTAADAAKRPARVEMKRRLWDQLLPWRQETGRTVEVRISGDVLRLTHASAGQQKALLDLFLARSAPDYTDMDALVDAAVALAKVNLGMAEHFVQAIADASERARAQIVAGLAEKDSAEDERVARTISYPIDQYEALERATCGEQVPREAIDCNGALTGSDDGHGPNQGLQPPTTTLTGGPGQPAVKGRKGAPGRR